MAAPSAASQAVAPPEMPRVVLMGLRRSGKTSIQKVVFERTPPHETTFLQSTARIQRNRVETSPFVRFQIWDLVGQVDYTKEGVPATPGASSVSVAAAGGPGAAPGATSTLQHILENCGAIVFVLDCRVAYSGHVDPFRVPDFDQAVRRLIDTVVAVHAVNPAISTEVFMHKVDALNEMQQMDLRRKVKQLVHDQVTSRLSTAGRSGGGGGQRVDFSVNYHLTSIFDHSVFEAFSLVVQRLMPQLSHVQSLLDMLKSNSEINQCFLFDVSSKIFVARDLSVFDRPSYELCSDAVDLMRDMNELYETSRAGSKAKEEAAAQAAGGEAESSSHSRLAPTVAEATSEAPSPVNVNDRHVEIVLQEGNVILLRSVTRTLTLACVADKAQFDKARPLVEYNVGVFHAGLIAMFGSTLE